MYMYIGDGRTYVWYKIWDIKDQGCSSPLLYVCYIVQISTFLM